MFIKGLEPRVSLSQFPPRRRGKHWECDGVDGREPPAPLERRFRPHHRHLSPASQLVTFASCAAPEADRESASAETAPGDEAEFLDPVAAAPQHYALELENDFVRVLGENLDAGEAVVMHSHRDRISVYLKDSELELRPRGGEPVLRRVVAGASSWSEELTHEGTTQSPVENLSIELQELKVPTSLRRSSTLSPSTPSSTPSTSRTTGCASCV